MAKGDVAPAEAVRLRDEATGVTVWQVTAAAAVSHHLYFLTSSMTPDGRHVVFASHRNGRPQLYLAGVPSGPIVQLTEGEGVHGYSGTLDRAGGRLFYTRGGEVRALDLATLSETILAAYPDGQLGEVSLSADGRRLVAAMKRGGCSYLTLTATDGAGGRVVHEWPRTIIHPQFHPADPDLIEYASDPAPRMWTIRADGSGNECLWEHGNDEFLVHETFLGAGDALAVVRWPHALQRLDLATRAMTVIARFTAWHIAPTRDGRLIVCDTAHPDLGLQVVAAVSGRRQTLCHPGSSNGGTQWTRGRYALAEDWAAVSAGAAADRAANLSWMEMGADTVYGPQWTHPHPSWSPDETRVVYTSDRTGHAQVYVAEVPPGLREALAG